MPSRAFDESAMTVTTYPTVCARNLLRTPSTNEGAIGGCERTHPNQPYSCIRELFVDGLPSHAQGLQGGHCQAGKLLQTGGFGLKAIAGIRQSTFSSDKFCKFVLHGGRLVRLT